MVLKHSNCCVNSGNTMRVRFFNQKCVHQLALKDCVIMKCVRNISTLPPADPQTWPLKLAEKYVTDGGLTCAALGFWGNDQYSGMQYSLKKKKRWQLEDHIMQAVTDGELNKEPFKITLVRRDHIITNFSCHRALMRMGNVTLYCDSHIPNHVVLPNKTYSFRSDLLQKGKENAEMKKEKRRQAPLHNKHFRGEQRKYTNIHQGHPQTIRTQNEDAGAMEIRYEMSVMHAPNSRGFQAARKSLSYRRYVGKGRKRRCRNGAMFRKSGKDQVHMHFEDALKLHCAGCSQTYAVNKLDYLGTYPNTLSDCYEDSYTVPAQREYSFLELLTVTSQQAHHNAYRISKSEVPAHDLTVVNPASSQRVRKHGKGSFIIIEREQDDLTEDLIMLSKDMDSVGDSGLPSDVDSDSASLLENAPVANLLTTLNSDNVFEMSDNIYCQCGVALKDLTMEILTAKFGRTVNIGQCSPYTIVFELHRAMSEFCGVHGDVDDSTCTDWSLVCQAVQIHADSNGNDYVLMSIKLHGNVEENIIRAANTCLRELTGHDTNQISLFSLDSLLLHSYNIMFQVTSDRCNANETNAKHTKSKPREIDAYLPHEKYVGEVVVSSVQEAYRQIESHTTVYPFDQVETTESASNLSCSAVMVKECSVCLSTADIVTHDEKVPAFVTMVACGHCFCRRCWQHHLASDILNGQTTFFCMEYRCKTTVDQAMLLSLISHELYTRWQQRVLSKTVERSGQWKWCPNKKCGHLAKIHIASCNVAASGVPVVCKCTHRWCLDCGLDAHWPISCQQFNSYRRMMQQNGDENGLKSSALIITSVHIKRCPGCQYPLEKNGGCMHMLCSQCSKSFCWVCLLDWTNHMNEAWVGCKDKGDETVELDNSKVYPLPIRCYKMAVVHRYAWKQLDRLWYQTVINYTNVFIFTRRQKATSNHLNDSALSHVLDAYRFLKQAYVLLELSYILLSNTPRHNKIGKCLRRNLELLDFSCSRIAERLDHSKSKVQVLRHSATLHTLTNMGHSFIHRICHLAHSLKSRITTSSQEWMLNANHEQFVRFK